MNIQETLKAMRADNIPAGTSGRWSVTKWAISTPLTTRRNRDKEITIAPGHYTNLHCLTLATMHQEPGELVMHDEPHELRKHLEFIVRARGSVLKTGLGLGCVVRGLLCNSAVTMITVVEREPDVLRLVGRHLFEPSPRIPIRLVQADALEWCKHTDQKFDCAWHDVWNDSDRDEKHLQELHGRLLIDTADRVRMQGAWEFPREFRRLFGRGVKMS